MALCLQERRGRRSIRGAARKDNVGGGQGKPQGSVPRFISMARLQEEEGMMKKVRQRAGAGSGLVGGTLQAEKEIWDESFMCHRRCLVRYWHRFTERVGHK